MSMKLFLPILAVEEDDAYHYRQEKKRDGNQSQDCRRASRSGLGYCFGEGVPDQGRKAGERSQNCQNEYSSPQGLHGLIQDWIMSQAAGPRMARRSRIMTTTRTMTRATS